MRPGFTPSLFALLALAACAGDPPPPMVAAPPPPPSLETVRASARASPLRHGLPAALVAAEPTMAAREARAVAAFYAERGYAPLWFDGGAYAPLRHALEVADGAGDAHAPVGDAARARRELALTRAALTAARDEVATAGDPGLVVAVRALADAIETAAPILAEAAVFGGQEAAIARYRTIVAAGGWPAIPPGATIEPGDAAAGLDALRRRLEITGDLEPGTSAGPRHDAALVAAVERFQRRHGLAVDGVVGPDTRQALDVPATARLAQLERAAVTVDRLVRELEPRYVIVNVPAFELRYVEDGVVRHAADVVVGSVANPTPAFADAIEYLIFNPYWHVPRSIAREELLSDFKEDAAGMAARGFQVIDAAGSATDPRGVDWTAVSPATLPFRFRQGPGDGNALGRVKFMFPNAHAVYLHDTPSRHLFERPARAFSHGCVRVEEPLTLAERLLAVEGYDGEDIAGWVAGGETRRVSLARPVPVHLVYVTAWRDADGTVQFRHDLYGREPRT